MLTSNGRNSKRRKVYHLFVLSSSLISSFFMRVISFQKRQFLLLTKSWILLAKLGKGVSQSSSTISHIYVDGNYLERRRNKNRESLESSQPYNALSLHLKPGTCKACFFCNEKVGRYRHSVGEI